MKHLSSLFTVKILLVFFLISSCSILKKSKIDKSITSKTEKSIFPEPNGFINDLENILTDEEEKELLKIILEHQAKTTDQIAIVTLLSYAPYENLEKYALDLANYWGVGLKDKNNGILIALGIGFQGISIQNGFGIETRLSDLETKRIIDEVILPEFKKANYFQGLKLGLMAISEELKKNTN